MFPPPSCVHGEGWPGEIGRGEYMALIPYAPKGEQRGDKVTAPPQFCVTSGQEKSDMNNPFPSVGHSNFPASLKSNSFS